MDAQRVDRALVLDENAARRARRSWLAVMEMSVWGDLKSRQVGALPKARKRTLEMGERLRSMFSSREWIPHPRERLKNALASYLNLMESMRELERAAGALESGSDLEAFRGELAALRAEVESLSAAAQCWSELLDSQYGADEA